MKLCGYEDCESSLRSNNASGFCYKHWAVAQPELVKKINREKTRRWRERNPEKARASTRASVQRWRDGDPEGSRAYKDAWNAANPEKYRNHYVKGSENRRARKLAAFVESVDPLTVWERDGGVCHICKTQADPNDWHLEHVVPLSRGGEHSYANVKVSHSLCNKRKRAKLLEEM